MHTDAINNDASDHAENKEVSFTSEQQSIYLKHKTVLLALRDHSWQLSEQEMNAVTVDEFIHVVIDQINEWAMDTLGDIIVVLINGRYILTEDYRSEITTFLDQAL
jgi:hypothetical protein